ncbi:MAG: ABC transporter ATP-binding protein [Candidatus Omnitrophica bacterium]|nr:ABC transporter ATP-binding protein [Candidatus Omnitrophota bacterium]
MRREDSLISASAIIKTYKEGTKLFPVLRGIDIDIGASEFVVIAGPSGAGKSTLLHILGGLDCPTSGRVVLGGEDIYSLSDEKRARLRNMKIGFVFQFYHLLGEFTVLENVLLPLLISQNFYKDNKLSLASKKTIRSRAQDALAMLGLKDRLDFSPAKLSGGEKQRVAIARALINDPDIILCDEPTGNLDSRCGEEIRGILMHLNREKKRTIVVVTHQQDLFSGCGRLINIRDGLISKELVLQEVK